MYRVTWISKDGKEHVDAVDWFGLMALRFAVMITGGEIIKEEDITHLN